MKNSTKELRVHAFLGQFDCSKDDTELYITALKLGPSTIQELAKSIGKHRVTIYSATEKLIQKGLMYETKRGKKRLIVGESPEKLSELIAQRQQELDLLKVHFDHTLKILAPLESHKENRPSVRFYEGKEGVRKMLEETLAARGEVLVFSYVEHLAEIVDADYLEKYFVRRAKKNIKTRLIFPDCPFSRRVQKKSKEYNIHIRQLPQHYEWKSGIFAWNQQIALLSYVDKKPTCTIIENADIHYFYRHIIFELCWRQATSSGDSH
jgi:sugar-specific transcriptional regulator TrmB